SSTLGSDHDDLYIEATALLAYSCDSCFVLNVPPSTNISTLSLHDALPIWVGHAIHPRRELDVLTCRERSIEHTLMRDQAQLTSRDRKSTRLNSSHRTTSYAVFCLKKKTSSMSQIS